MAAHLGKKLNAHYYETSELTGYNVKEAFEKIAELVHLSKTMNNPLRIQNLIVKSYQGKTIKTLKPIEKKLVSDKPCYKIIDPYWLDSLDRSSRFPFNPFRSYPRTIKIKKIKKESTKRQWAKSSTKQPLICERCGATLFRVCNFCGECGNKISR
jgi:hypothetical protein